MTESLSVDAAVDRLLAQPEINNDEPDVDTSGAQDGDDSPDVELDFWAGDSDQPGDDEDGAEGRTGDDDEADDGGEADLPRIDPPEFWEADYKAQFANLSHDAQKLVAEQARAGSAALAKAVNDATAHRKAAEAEAQALAQHRAKLESILPQAEQTFASRWAQVNWASLYQNDPARYAELRVAYDQDQAAIAQLAEAKQQSDQQALAQYYQTVHQELAALAQTDSTAAQLVSSPKAAQNRTALANYLVGLKIPKEAVERIGPHEAIVAYKAMLYDQAIARQNSKPATGSQRKTQSSGAMHAPTGAARSPKTLQAQSARQRLERTGSTDDAVALLLSRQSKTRK